MEHVSAYRLYQIYVALVLHFEGKYNAVKYNFRSRVSEKSFDKHNCKYKFKTFAPMFREEIDAVKFVSANIISGNKWIGAFKKNVEFPQVNFEEDCKKYGKSYSDIKKLVENMMNSQEYDSMSFFILYDFATKGETFKKLNEEYQDNILFTEFQTKYDVMCPIYIFCWNVLENDRIKFLNELLG